MLKVFAVLGVFCAVAFAGDILNLKEEPECDFDKLASEERYLYVVGLIMEKHGKKVVVEPIKEENIDKIMLKLSDETSVNPEDEEIEFLVLEDNKACIKRRSRR